MNKNLSCLLSVAALVLASLVSTSASAVPVVVGSVNPDTKQVTIFEDLLVKKFQDGTPILKIYGSFKEITHEFIMVRTGKKDLGTCQTDAFKLVRVAGNRLAIAASDMTRMPWDGIGEVLTIKRCFSETCSGNCQVLGDPDTLDTTDYQCHCTSASGLCEATLNLPHKHEDIVWQEQ